MRAVEIVRPGGPEVLALARVPEPEPEPREALVAVRASGVNRADLLQRRGLYPPPPGASEIPGLEFAGVVAATGSAVARWKRGDRVMGIVPGGGYAERVVAREETLWAAPSGMAMTTAAAIPEAYATAYDAAFRQAGLTAGETCLIHAVGSGVGLAALQLAKRAGARAIGTSRTASKVRRATAMGLDAGTVVEAGREADWPARVLDATDGRGVDVILDLVGGPYLAGNQAVVAERGRHVAVGVPGGARAEIDLRALMTRRARLFGTVLRSRGLEERAALARDFEERVLPGFGDGSLAPVVDRVHPAAAAAAAHRRMEANRTFGKVVLAWADAASG